MPYIKLEDLQKIPIRIDHYDEENGNINFVLGIEWAIEYAESLPEADVVEVKHGTWKLHKDGSGTCDQCHFTQRGMWDYDNWQRYCGVCGANMDNINCEEWTETNYESKNHRRTTLLGFRKKYQ